MEKLKLGTARCVITPKIGAKLYGYDDKTVSTGIHDDLTATAFVFSYKEKKGVLLCLTLCSVGDDLSDMIRERISKENDIPFENIMLTAGHTHTGPGAKTSYGWGNADTDYIENILLARIFPLVKRAAADMKNVTVGIAERDSFAAVNRRERTDKGTVTLGQRKDGPLDPRMTVISFKDETGRVAANIIHYACHGTCAGRSTLIGRDYFGVMCDMLEDHSGGITAFINGAEGDIGPRLSNGRTVGDYSLAEETGGIAGADAIKTFGEIKEYSDLPFSVISGTMEFPLKKRISADEARALLSTLNPTRVNVTGHTANYCEKVIASYENGYEEKGKRLVPINAFIFGNIAITAFPYELFTQIAQRIDKESRFRVLSVSNANGSRGYFPTKKEIPLGGYEIRMYLYGDIERYSDDAEDIFVSETIKILGGK